ncbi:MAG: hypothetical protein K8R88_15350 [Armatimonadetes bacterium]|nr:hypothetical protein [Armatimonadota bacterium]
MASESLIAMIMVFCSGVAVIELFVSDQEYRVLRFAFFPTCLAAFLSALYLGTWAKSRVLGTDAGSDLFQIVNLMAAAGFFAFVWWVLGAISSFILRKSPVEPFAKKSWYIGISGCVIAGLIVSLLVSRFPLFAD